jgi:uncharacterized protein (TIGR02246 family)
MDQLMPQDAHRQFEDAFNSGDLEALLALYTPDARLVTEAGNVVVGYDAIREELEGFFAVKGRMTVQTISAVQGGDIALLRAEWHLTGIGPDNQPVAASGKTSEVVQRQADGRWLYLIDNPHGSE